MKYKPFSKLLRDWRFASQPRVAAEENRQFFLALDKEVEADRKALGPLMDKYRDAFLRDDWSSLSSNTDNDASVLARALGAQKIRG